MMAHGNALLAFVTRPAAPVCEDARVLYQRRRIAMLGDLSGRPWLLTSDDAGASWTYGELPGVTEDACPVDVVVGARSMVVIGGCGGPLAWVADR